MNASKTPSSESNNNATLPTEDQRMEDSGIGPEIGPEIDPIVDDSPTLVFAYGSLIWRPGFNYASVFKAHVDGFERRFWQASHDHRGTPDKPGRVVTLVAIDGGRCEGLVFRLPPDQSGDILSELDFREKDGYERQMLRVADSNGVQYDALTWIARPDNPSWRGEMSVSSLARLIAQRHGPSGSNAAYLMNLVKALVEHQINDPHIEELNAAVLRYQGAASAE